MQTQNKIFHFVIFLSLSISFAEESGVLGDFFNVLGKSTTQIQNFGSRFLSPSHTESKVRSIKPSEFNPGSGSGMVVSGVNLFTGQPSQSLPLMGISNGNTSWQFQLSYGGAYAQYGQDNQSTPSGWVGSGWELSTPGVMVNNKGTLDITDDVFYCNLGAYGGGQILVAGTGTNQKFILASNPAIEINAYAVNSVSFSNPKFENQIIKWRFRFPDGKQMIFGDDITQVSNKVGHIRSQLGRGSKIAVNNQRNSLNTSSLAPNHKAVPYRWDLREFSDFDGKNALYFNYMYAFVSPVFSNNSPQWLSTDENTPDLSNTHYVREGYLKEIYWKDALNNKREFLRFKLVNKSSEYFQRYNDFSNVVVQPLYETQELEYMKSGVLDDQGDTIIKSKIEFNLKDDYPFIGALTNDFFRTKRILDRLTFVNDPVRKAFKFNYDRGMLTRIEDSKNNFTKYHYGTSLSTNQEEVQYNIKDKSSNLKIVYDKISESGVSGNGFNITTNISLWPQSRSSCVEDICYHILNYNEVVSSTINNAWINFDYQSDRYNVGMMHLSVYKSTVNGLPKQIWEHKFGFDPDAAPITGDNGELLKYKSGRFDWKFRPLDENNFIVYSDKGDWRVAYLHHINETRTGIDYQQDISQLVAGDQKFPLNSVAIGDGMMVIEYRSQASTSVFKIFERNEKTLVWSEVSPKRIDPILADESQFGQQLRREYYQDFPIAINDGSQASLSVSGKNIMIFHNDHDVSILYRRNSAGKYELAFKPIRCKTSYDQYTESEYNDAGMTIVNDNYISKNNMCYFSNIQSNYTGSGVMGSWYYIAKQDNKGGQWLRVYYDIGDRYKAVAFINHTFSNAVYGDDKFFFYQSTDNDRLHALPLSSNIDELKIAGGDENPGNCTDHNNLNNGFPCLVYLSDPQSTGSKYVGVKPIPGGYVIQGYKAFGLPAEKGNTWDVRLWKVNENWALDGGASPMTEVKSIVYDNGSSVDLSKIWDIEYSPVDGLIRIKWSKDKINDLSGQKCAPFNDHECVFESKGYLWTWSGTPTEPKLMLMVANSVTYDSYTTNQNGLLAHSVENTPQFLITSNLGLDNSNVVQKVNFKTYRGFNYGNTPINSPKIVTDVIRSNSVSDALQSPISRTKINYISSGANEACSGVPLGSLDNYGEVEYSGASLLPKYRTVSVTQCTDVNGDCYSNLDGSVQEKLIYRFYLQGTETGSIKIPLVNTMSIAGDYYSPSEMMDGQLLQTMTCGRKGEFRGIQQNYYDFAKEASWPQGMIQNYVDSSMQLSVDRRGIVSRVDSKTLAFDPLTRTPLETHQWKTTNGGRQLSVQKMTMKDYVYGPSDDPYTFRIPEEQKSYVIPRTNSFPMDLNPYLVSYSKNNFDQGMLDPLLIPKFDRVWVPNRLSTTDQNMRQGQDLSSQSYGVGSWRDVSERTKLNSRRQLLEQKNIPISGEATIYQSTVYEGIRSQPVASFGNAPWNSIGYLGMEDGAGGNSNLENKWDIPNWVQLSTLSPFSGLYSAEISGQYGPGKNIELSLDRVDEGYVASVWMKSNSNTSPILTIELRQEDGTKLGHFSGSYLTKIPVSKVFKSNEWQRYELRLSAEQLRANGNFGNVKTWLRVWAGFENQPSAGQKIYLDDFVMYPSKASFTLQAYDVWGRPISKTDMTHLKSTVEYAPDGSVLAKRDHKGMISTQEFNQTPTVRK